MPAILAYNGQAYKHLKASTLSDDALLFGQKHLWITCFLYGLLRPSDAVRPVFPEVCPDCGTALVKEDDEAKWFCPNIDGCPTQIKGKLVHFLSRKAMNVLAGDATIEQMYNLGLVRTPADFYSLTKGQLLLAWMQCEKERL